MYLRLAFGKKKRKKTHLVKPTSKSFNLIFRNWSKLNFALIYAYFVQMMAPVFIDLTHIANLVFAKVVRRIDQVKVSS